MRKLRPTLLGLAVIALALAGPAAARPHKAPAPKKGGRYVGRSSQGKRVTFRIDRKGRKVTLRMPERLNCAGGPLAYVDDELGFDTRIKKHRSFGESSSESDDIADDPDVGSGNLTVDYVDSVSGRFSRARKKVYRRLSGKFHTRMTIRDGSGAAVEKCDSGTVRFTATLVKR
jgi:hypothetical protein